MWLKQSERRDRDPTLQASWVMASRGWNPAQASSRGLPAATLCPGNPMPSSPRSRLAKLTPWALTDYETGIPGRHLARVGLGASEQNGQRPPSVPTLTVCSPTPRHTGFLPSFAKHAVSLKSHSSLQTRRASFPNNCLSRGPQGKESQAEGEEHSPGGRNPHSPARRLLSSRSLVFPIYK